MSCLECDRYYCPNVMCDLYSGEHGYICGSCFAEMRIANPQTHEEIEEFMETPPGTYKKEPDGPLFIDDVFKAN